MINAYYSGYLNDAQDALGNMMEYGINICGYDPEEFFIMFLTSGVATQFEKGNPEFIAGMSGGELAKR